MKRPDGMTLTPFHGKSWVWDVTCPDTMAFTYIGDTSVKPGAAAALAETKKNTKHEYLPNYFLFSPLAFETMSVLGRRSETHDEVIR